MSGEREGERGACGGRGGLAADAGYSSFIHRSLSLADYTVRRGCEGLQTTFSFIAGFDIEGMVSKLIVFSMLRRTLSSLGNRDLRSP